MAQLPVSVRTTNGTSVTQSLITPTGYGNSSQTNGMFLGPNGLIVSNGVGSATTTSGRLTLVGNDTIAALTVNTNDFIVNSNGFISINTNTANTLIEINARTNSNGGTIRFVSSISSIGPSFSFINDLGDSLLFRNNPSGFAGSTLGNIPDSGLLSVSGTNGITFDSTSANANAVIRFATGGNSLIANERIRIDVNGLIGINTVSPTERLTVNGNGSISTNLFVTNSGGTASIFYGDANVTNAFRFSTSGLTVSNGVGSVVHQSGATTNTGIGSFTAGVGSYSSNLLAWASITVGSSPFSWTNTTTKNVFVGLDAAVAITSATVNGSGLFGAQTDALIPLQPGEYTTVTYPAGAPTMRWKPF